MVIVIIIFLVSGVLAYSFLTLAWYGLGLTVCAAAVWWLIIGSIWRAKNRISGTKLRRTVSIATAVSSIPLFLFLLTAAYAGFSTGDCQCVICGRQIEENTFWDIPFFVQQGDSPYHSWNDFEKWYNENVAIEHEHDWQNIGCRFSGYGFARYSVMCSSYGTGQYFFKFMPVLPDTDTAAGMVKKLVASPAEERYQLLSTFNTVNWGEDIWGNFDYMLVQEKPMSRDEFLTNYAVWLEAHPEWR